MLCRQPALKPARKCQRKSGCASKRTLAAIAIKNNTHPDRVCNPTQVCRICRELSGKYPGDCSLPDTGCFADLLLADAALLCYFCEAGGDYFCVVHASQSCSIGFGLKFSADFTGFPPSSKKTKVSSAHPPAGQLATKWPVLSSILAR